MKNKKLFAILTLVCFMFTLMPVAAFAADLDADQVYVGELEEATVVTGDNNVEANVGGETANYVFYVVDEDGKGVAVSSAVGNGTFSLKTVGDYKVYAIDVNGYTTVADVLAAIDTPANKVAKLIAWAEPLDLIVDGYATVEVTAPEMEYEIVVAGDKTIAANNGFTNGDGEMVATLYSYTLDEEGEKVAESKKPVKGVDLTFSPVGYVTIVTEDGVKTDKNGEVEFRAVSEVAGEYKVVVKYGKLAKETVTVKVQASTATDVEVYSAPASAVNKDTYNANVEFKFVDSNGVAFDVLEAGQDVAITVVEKPAASKMDKEDFSLVPDEDEVAGVVGLAAEFDKVGTYKVKVALENGASATATVEVAEMDDVVAVKFYKPVATVVYGTEATVAQGIMLEDANGVVEVIDLEDVALSVTGKAVKSFADGKVVVKDDEDYVGSTITVYAVYNDEFVANTTITVTDAAAQIVYNDKTAEVAVNNTLYATVVDADGKNVTLNNTTCSAIILDKPENAVAVASASYTAKAGVTLNLLVSEVGEYEIQTVVTYKDATGVTRYLTSIDTFTVGAGNKTFKDVVVMSIGANKLVKNSEVKEIPTAPVIENGRTMVPLRALVEAFGADVVWDDATRSVTVTLDNTVVVMTVDAKAYTVNGVEKTADVAPFINADNYTMVPVRFVAQAFGITPTPIANETGAVVDVMFAK